MLTPNTRQGQECCVYCNRNNVVAEWKFIAPGQHFDLLKFDIEKFKLELIRNSGELLSLIDRIVMEWHKWVTSMNEIDVLLAEHGFARTSIVTEDQHTAVAVFDRRRS